MKSLYQVKNRCKRRRLRLQMLVALLYSALILAACTTGRPPASTMRELTDDLDRESLHTALRRSVSYLEKLPPDRIVGEQPRRFTAGEVLDSLLAFEQSLDNWDCRECWMRDFSKRFDLIPSSSDVELDSVLFTGYYQPVIEGSLAPTSEYAYPIYGMPADLIVTERATSLPSLAPEKVTGRLEGGNLVPYYSRREIDELGSLQGHGYEIAWVKNPIDLFFLHIQGSGRSEERRVGNKAR